MQMARLLGLDKFYRERQPNEGDVMKPYRGTCRLRECNERNCASVGDIRRCEIGDRC